MCRRNDKSFYLPSSDDGTAARVFIIISVVFFLLQRSLATDLQALSMDFRKLQKGYLGKLRLQNEVCYQIALCNPISVRRRGIWIHYYIPSRCAGKAMQERYVRVLDMKSSKSVQVVSHCH